VQHLGQEADEDLGRAALEVEATVVEDPVVGPVPIVHPVLVDVAGGVPEAAVGRADLREIANATDEAGLVESAGPGDLLGREVVGDVPPRRGLDRLRRAEVHGCDDAASGGRARVRSAIRVGSLDSRTRNRRIAGASGAAVRIARPPTERNRRNFPYRPPATSESPVVEPRKPESEALIDGGSRILRSRLDDRRCVRRRLR
jgi:hypothetical protein